ncbi:unnamed protein product [Adineta ricciae]|uniref:Uncharacterized protein n=1 Tax=Adineta ricciae TaxID=249248 RepID=A0A816BRY4_ADIRI|nr:unnamed protein product [Adineta ricciae]
MVHYKRTNKLRRIVGCGVIVILMMHLSVIYFEKDTYEESAQIQTGSKQGHLIDRRSQKYNEVNFPCIEPWCVVTCMNFYGAIHGKHLSPEQRIHIAIDKGLDNETNQLISQYPPPKTCTYSNISSGASFLRQPYTVNYFPLAFGFIETYLLGTISHTVYYEDEHQVVNETCIPKKSREFSRLVPGDLTTYEFQFGDEAEYKRQYMSAYFALTKKKGGWDCNRHYEIIASAAMPYFENLNESGSYTLAHLPKSLLNDARNMYGIKRTEMKLDHAVFNFTHYFILLHRLIYYSRHRLTTRKMTEYMLKTVNYSQHQNMSARNSVLYISHASPDYMKDLMLHGFTLIFQENLYVYEPPEFMYKYSSKNTWTFNNTRNYYRKALYGLGYGYALSLRNYEHLWRRDKAELSSERVHWHHFDRTTSQPYTTYQMCHEAYTRASSPSPTYFSPSTSLPRDHSPFHPEIGNSANKQL